MTPQVFISYSHQDEKQKDQIQAHLEVLVHEGKLSVWDDRQIQAGQDWLPAIEQAMASCQVALLLVSKDFLNSRFVRGREIPALLRRRAAEGVRVIPVILKPCAWQHVSWLQGLQARPKDGKALSGMSEHDADAAMAGLVVEIDTLLSADPQPQAEAPQPAPVNEAKDQPAPPVKSKPPLPFLPKPFRLPPGLHKLAYALSGFALVGLLWKPVVVWLENQSQLTAALPRDLPKDCPDCPAMVELPPGEFMMGSSEGEAGRSEDEGPRHKVKIGYRLAVGKYEVSFAEWDACEAAKACPHADDQGWGRRNGRPAFNVSWDDAQTYIRWLNGKTGQNYRLPTEAEWEYAARAGTTTPFSAGTCITTAQANYDGTSDYNGCGAKTGVFLRKTQPVGHYPAIPGLPWDLRDMHGNVWEWVQDCYHEGYLGAPDDGSAWDGGTDCASGRRVLRGGSWYDDPRDLRSANRIRDEAGDRDFNIGFRLARTLTP